MAIQRVTQVAAIVTMLVVVGQSAGSEVLVVAPEGLADTEGDNEAGGTPNDLRIQYLYPASDFASLPSGKNTIVAVAVRLDGLETSPVTVNNPDSKITLSTTTTTNLSPRFDTNLTDDATVVFEGSRTRIFPATGPAGGPHPFETPTQFQTPFRYDPAQGRSLVVDIVASTPSDVGVVTDFQDVGYTGIVFSSSPLSNGGETFQIVQVLEFTFVPEPSTAIMAVLAAVGFVAFGRKRLCG